MNADRLNQSFQDKLYELIDSKADGLADCTVTEIIDVAAAAIASLVGTADDALAQASPLNHAAKGIISK